ncbi:MAG: ACP S-malonyltransferase [Leptospiraceae bacterium]|nr:ACP S-malonyltransferase [Leptospiraceae bacterium]
MSKLISSAQSSNQKIFVQFGGQGSPYLKEVSKLYLEEPILKDYFELAFRCLEKQNQTFPKGEFPFEHGHDLKTWIENPEQAPPDEYIMRSSIQAQMIFITQFAYYHLAILKGYSPSLFKENTLGCTGHSQGVIAATLFSLCLEGTDFETGFENYIDFMYFLVYHAQLGFTELKYSNEVMQGNLELGEKNPAPMVAILGYTKNELFERVTQVNSECNFPEKEIIHISLFNAPDSMILSAPPSSLLKFRQKFKQEMDENKKKFLYLRTTSPLHSPILEYTAKNFRNDLEKGKFCFPYTPKDLKFPVYSIFDGKDYRNKNFSSIEFAEFLYAEIVVRPLHWNLALSSLFPNENCHSILDFGPSPISTKLTQLHLSLNQSSIPIYSSAIQKDAKSIYHD